jgi:predicted dehydrogenase
MIRIGIVGIGYLGRIHVSLLQELAAQFEIVGIHDHKPIDGREVSAALQALPFFESYQALIGAADAVAIIASTPAHFLLAHEALLAGKAVFIEKPMCATLSEAQELCVLALQQQSFVQVGHVERFNPALEAATSFSVGRQLLGFDASRTAPFQQRGSDVSVVLDLMIHDLDLLLAHASSQIVAIEVVAKSEKSAFSDEVQASIEFEDGLKAKLFASRISDHKQRTLRLQMPEHTIALDLLEKTASLQPNAGSESHNLEVVPNNALQTQWLDFASAYHAGHAPRVGVEAGLRALALALEIEARAQAQIAQNSKHFIQ